MWTLSDGTTNILYIREVLPVDLPCRCRSYKVPVPYRSLSASRLSSPSKFRPLTGCEFLPGLRPPLARMHLPEWGTVHVLCGRPHRTDSYSCGSVEFAPLRSQLDSETLGFRVHEEVPVSKSLLLLRIRSDSPWLTYSSRRLTILTSHYTPSEPVVTTARPRYLTM